MLIFTTTSLKTKIILGAVALGLSASTVFAQEATVLEDGVNALSAGNYQVAAEKFSEGFKAGDVDGAFYLGRMLELGLGGTPDLTAAIGLYIAGSAKGSGPAKNRLGVLHIQGTGVLQDYEEGAKLICASADVGDVNGAYNCASLLLEGKGVERDEATAYTWFKKASDLGHMGAKNEYANALIEGKFIEQDVKGAVELFQQTAANGNPVGLYALGQAFAAGLGVDQNLIKAHSYFNVAAALQHPQAAGARTALEQQMSTEDVRKAQQLAKAWRPNASANTE